MIAFYELGADCQGLLMMDVKLASSVKSSVIPRNNRCDTVCL